MFIRRTIVTRVDDSDIVELSNFITINSTSTTLNVTAEFSGRFNLICKDDPTYQWFRDQEYKLTWNITFDQLINDPRATGFDYWDIRYPKFPVIDQDNLLIPNISTTFKEIGGGAGSSICRLVIAPNAKSFDDVNMNVFTKKQAKIKANKHVCDMCRPENHPVDSLCPNWVHVSERFADVTFTEISPLKYRVIWPSAIRPVEIRLSCDTGHIDQEFQILKPGGSVDFQYDFLGEKKATLYFGTRTRIMTVMKIKDK